MPDIQYCSSIRIQKHSSRNGGTQRRVDSGAAVIHDKSTLTVKGLTSMTSPLLSGAIGISVGTGQYLLAGGIVVLGFIVLFVLHPFEKKMRTQPSEKCKDTSTS
ncbi:MAG: hypothetical protein GF398_03215 [Chitinivibrionales bacterium]|nr:hypothetical protein [Chitinivibrionales bacterium]